MNFQSNEQTIHDKVNLARLVRRLEKTIAAEDWDTGNLPPRATWIRTNQTLQKLKYARKLLDNVELHESDQNAFRAYEDLRSNLARLHSVVSQVNDRVKPPSTRPTPILPTLPLPSPSEPPIPSIHVYDRHDVGNTQHDTSHGDSKLATDELLSPSDTLLDSAILLPADPPSSAAPSKAAPAFLQNSSAIQEELSAQLAQMATQLKRNAQHFSESLDKDKALVQETQEKLERNHDVMSKERVRVRDHHSKSWGTTWLVMLSMLVALVGFILTFFVIRLT